MSDATNTALANTTEYKTPANPRLVIRRAQQYFFTITTNKEVPQANWTFFPSAKRTWDGTSIAMFAGNAPFPTDKWYFKVTPGFVGVNSQEFLLQISIPSEAEIGTYEFRVDATAGVPPGIGAGRAPAPGIQKIFPKRVVVLFNPWQSTDVVYLADAKERDEYVKSEDGLMRLAVAPKAWKYNQFDENTLDVLTFLLDNSFPDRTFPPLVVREVAGFTNWRYALPGLVEGKWGGGFGAETNPETWTGSGEIIKKYVDGGHKTVKYGQCWVFAGLATTLCRAAGIPARPVSSFGTAIDNGAPCDGIIDAYFKWDGTKYVFDEVKTTDGAWNYHVWTETWMKRLDLVNRDGWQLIDPTGQTKGPGRVEIGPAARESIIYEIAPPNAVNFDAGFMWSSAFAELRLYEDSAASPGVFVLKKTRTSEEAKFAEHVWTKQVGAIAVEDIEGEYRPFGRSPTAPARSGGFNVVFHAPESVSIGQNVTGTLTINNSLDVSRTLTFSFGARLLYYNGDLATWLADPAWNPIVLLPGQSVDVPLTIGAGAMAPFIGGTQTFVNFIGAVHDAASGQTEYIYGESTQLAPPPLGLGLVPAGAVRIGQAASAVVTFTNTTGLTLTGVKAVYSVGSHLSMSGFDKTEYGLPNLAPGQVASIPAQSFQGVTLGLSPLSASLFSDQMPAASANVSVAVVSCTGDINGDQLVDDTDFQLFVVSYNELDCASPNIGLGCPGDFSGDGFVDDQDFQLFVPAYNQLVCDP